MLTVLGCASGPTKEQLAAQQKAQQDAQQRLINVRENWSKLNSSLTFEETERLVGPFDPAVVSIVNSTKQWNKMLLSSNKDMGINSKIPLTVSHLYDLVFYYDVGKYDFYLQSWTLKSK
jgi:hypothetical protein